MEQLYMDEKWKLSKRGSRNNGSRRVYTGDMSSTSSGTSASGTGTAFFKRSESAREARSGTKSSSRSLSSRCAGLVKEQRARFYIMRRCVTMLVCWKDYA